MFIDLLSSGSQTVAHNIQEGKSIIIECGHGELLWIIKEEKGEKVTIEK